MRTSRYTDEQIIEAVKTSKSIAEVMRKIGMKWAGGSQCHLKGRIEKLGLDTSHFTGQLWNKGRRDLIKKSPSEIFVMDRFGDGRKDKCGTLKRCLFEIGRSEVCEICGQLPTWNNLPLILQIHHKNGNPIDNREENLMFVCPNCHTQTETFSSRNKR